MPTLLPFWLKSVIRSEQTVVLPQSDLEPITAFIGHRVLDFRISRVKSRALDTRPSSYCKMPMIWTLVGLPFPGGLSSDTPTSPPLQM